jgi:hypothetical protein
MTCSRMVSRTAISALIFMAMSAASGRAETTPPTFALDIAATPAQEVQLTIPTPTTLSFKIIRGGGPVPEGFAIDVGNFINPQGVVVPVSISLDGDPDKGEKHIVPGGFTQGLLSVNLHVKQFPAPGKYTGAVTVTSPGADAKSTLWRFVLTSDKEVRPATLVLDQNAVTVQGVLSFCLWGRSYCQDQDPLVVVVHAREKTRNWPLTGVTARLESGSKTPGAGFDSTSQLEVTFNGQPVPDFFSASTLPKTLSPKADLTKIDLTKTDSTKTGLTKTDSTKTDSTKTDSAKTDSAKTDSTKTGSAKTDLPKTASSSPPIAPTTSEPMIPEGKQATIKLAFTPREPGEYTIPMRITAANSADDDLQKLIVTLQVRNGVSLAIFVLLFAALFSFLATRVVTMLRQRAAFLIRVRALRPAWLAKERPILPVIWLRATLRLADDLSRRFWLLGSGSSEIDARLTAAAAMLATLDRVRQVRERILTIPEPMVQHRAGWKLDDIVARLGPAPLSDQDIAFFKTQLDAFDQWFDPDPKKKQAAYWENLLPDIQTICAKVPGVTIPEDNKPLAKELREALEAAQTAATSLDLMTKAEENYQRLEILLELCRRKQTDLIGRLGKTADEVPIDRVLAVADDAWWALLKKLGDKVTVAGPSATLDPLEAYESATFRVETPSEPFLTTTFLMRKKLRYDWTITIFRKEKKIGDLHVESSQPQVAQYSPTAGSMKATVKISYDGNVGPEISSTELVNVSKSNDFRIFAKYEQADLIAFTLAAAVSVVSGLAVYVLKPTFFGSLPDYLTLFVWGASIDQGKNFLQSLGTYAATTNK